MRDAQEIIDDARKLKSSLVRLTPKQYRLVYLYTHSDKKEVPDYDYRDFFHTGIKFIKILPAQQN